MKPKTVIPTAEQVRAQGQIELDFSGSLDPQDRRLPHPQGNTFNHKGRINLAELQKLEAVRNAGGLVADDGLRWVWSCSACGEHFKTSGQAWHCCRAEPQLTQICIGCGRPPNQCQRLPERCAWRKR